MRALVIGGAGFLGSSLVDRLLAEEHRVDVIDDLSTGTLANLADARLGGRRLRFHQLDVRDPALVDLVVALSPEVVFHLAQPSSAELGYDEPVRDAEIGLIGTLRVLEGARLARSRKVVVAASAALYGRLSDAELPAHEHLALRPVAPEGIRQRAVMDYLASYRERYGLEFSVLACSSIYGPRELEGAEPGIVGRLISDLRAGRRATIRADAATTVDLLFVDDAVDAFSRAAQRGSGLLLNIASGEEVALGALGALVTRLSRMPVSCAGAGTPTARRLVLDPARAELHLAWRPFTSLVDGVAATLAAAGLLVASPAGGEARR